MKTRLIECVPNFSEGNDLAIIKQITDGIESVAEVKLLDVDPGKATNRTVVTFAGEPEAVIEAAYRAIEIASQLIDMRHHKGEHPRFGATDVCPLIPVAGVSMDECVAYARQLGERIGKSLGIPVYCYEYAATSEKRKNLATIRAGEYEGIAEKIKLPEWKPDYGPATFNPRSGNIAIGARDFLIAYNINLNTTSVRRANSVAFDIREAGRIKRTGNPVTGEIVYDANGDPVRIPGTCKAVKGIGWFIEEYGIAQVSMNLTNIQITPLHIAFDEAVKSAHRRGMRVTGSELVGLVPLQSMLAAGRYFLQKQKLSTGVSDTDLIAVAVKSMGLDELSPFDADKKIIEYVIKDKGTDPLIQMTLRQFADKTASESPAPGGGSTAAFIGTLGASLATMVGNLSAHKRGWDKRWKYFSDWAEEGKKIKDELLMLVDEDTRSFNMILEAFRLPKGNDAEITARQKAIQEATEYAVLIPFKVMKAAYQSFDVIAAMVKHGNPNSVTDAGVGALCARTAVMGAHLNVKINAMGLKNTSAIDHLLAEADEIAKNTIRKEKSIIRMVESRMK